MRSAICGFLSILAMTACLSFATTDDDARAFAESVLTMKDNKQYKEMYRDKFHQSMQSQFTEEQWLAAAAQVDRQTGAQKGAEPQHQRQEHGRLQVPVRYAIRKWPGIRRYIRHE